MQLSIYWLFDRKKEIFILVLILSPHFNLYSSKEEQFFKFKFKKNGKKIKYFCFFIYKKSKSTCP